ncbi:hypothetical protein HDU76_009623 [Blyttiomyces sp. JEL0837]|nr:hypothetical protein HDU76_009623 [Blyttiomyces sp. JEL0837]
MAATTGNTPAEVVESINQAPQTRHPRGGGHGFYGKTHNQHHNQQQQQQQQQQQHHHHQQPQQQHMRGGGRPHRASFGKFDNINNNNINNSPSPAAPPSANASANASNKPDASSRSDASTRPGQPNNVAEPSEPQITTTVSQCQEQQLQQTQTQTQTQTKAAEEMTGFAIPPSFASFPGGQRQQQQQQQQQQVPGISMLSPGMPWSQCDLPAQVWFELAMRANAVLSAAAMNINGPNGFYGWNGPIGVVAPDAMWDALRAALDELRPFKQPEMVPAVPVMAPSTATGKNPDEAKSSLCQQNGQQGGGAATQGTQNVNNNNNTGKLARSSSQGWGGNSNGNNNNNNQGARKPPLPPGGSNSSGNGSATGMSGGGIGSQSQTNTLSRKPSNSRSVQGDDETDRRHSSDVEDRVLAKDVVSRRPMSSLSEGSKSRFVGINYDATRSDDEATSPPSPPLVPLDACDAPLPGLILPQAFLKEVRNTFGSTVVFHTPKPGDQRIFFAFKELDSNDAQRKQNAKIFRGMLEKHNLEFGSHLRWAEALRSAELKKPNAGHVGHSGQSHGWGSGSGGPGGRGRGGGFKGGPPSASAAPVVPSPSPTGN